MQCISGAYYQHLPVVINTVLLQKYLNTNDLCAITCTLNSAHTCTTEIVEVKVCVCYGYL